MEASEGIGREGWRILSGGQWRDWQRGVEDTEWRPVEGLAERDGRYRTVANEEGVTIVKARDNQRLGTGVSW
ncbi:unnamed protein product, partial [Staurois parvus]